MNKFIGVKQVEAQAMTRGAYNEFRGWTIPDNEDPSEPGFLITYADKYISWTPKKQFDEAYRPCSAMNFGLAVEAMKRGEKVARSGWNGSGQWVALGEGSAALPASEFWNKHTRLFAVNNGGTARVLPYFILKTAQDTILMGWSPSQSDALAEDWQIVV